MSDLEEFGLVSAPHTSAGRVPTSQGYRVFVDSLLEVRPLDEPAVDKLRRELPTDAPAPDLLSSATSLLSEMTHFVGVVSMPKREEFPFRHIDFVPLDASRAAGDPGLHRRAGAEPRDRDAARLLAERARADRELPQREFRRHAHRRDPRAAVARDAGRRRAAQRAAVGRGRGRAAGIPGQRRPATCSLPARPT